MKHRRFLRDNRKRILYRKTELFQRLLKVLSMYKEVLVIKLIIQKNFLSGLEKNSFKVRIKNFCILSGRSRAVYRNFKVSRIHLRSMSASGLFFGVKKASW